MCTVRVVMESWLRSGKIKGFEKYMWEIGLNVAFIAYSKKKTIGRIS